MDEVDDDLVEREAMLEFIAWLRAAQLPDLMENDRTRMLDHLERGVHDPAAANSAEALIRSHFIEPVLERLVEEQRGERSAERKGQEEA